MARPRFRHHRQTALRRVIPAGVFILALALTLGACSRTSSPSSSEMSPGQLSIEQILAGVLAAAGDASGGAGGETFVQGQGEIFLEPAGTEGPESFAGGIHVVRGPTTTFSIPGTSTTQPVTTLAPGQVTAWSGGTPGLYGGSRNKAVCDKEAQLRFLEQNPDKAAAFAAALNSDPNLRWAGGNKVIPDQLRAYFAELTPLILTRDTRVTNHGFRNGLPTPRQSVLQAGQAVLVDKYGVPRVRCECGNPLNPPQPVSTTPVYTGPKWENFDPTTVVVIQQTTVVIDTFVVMDVQTGETFDRPSGSSGEQDVPRETTTSSTTTSSTTTSSTTTTTIASTTTSTTPASTTTTRRTTTTTLSSVSKLDPNDAAAKIKVFYNTRGEWAGIYVMKSILRMRIVMHESGRSATLHVEYQYALPETPNVTDGVDTRTFEMAWDGHTWIVKSMGGHMSGKI